MELSIGHVSKGTYHCMGCPQLKLMFFVVCVVLKLGGVIGRLDVEGFLLVLAVGSSGNTTDNWEPPIHEP